MTPTPEPTPKETPSAETPTPSDWKKLRQNVEACREYSAALFKPSDIIAILDALTQARSERDEAVAKLKKETPPKMAPVQGYAPGIPWELHLKAYAVYCERYGPQKAMIEGWCRGGFGASELDMFIPGWRDEVDPINQMKRSLTTARGIIGELVTRGRDNTLFDSDILTRAAAFLKEGA